MEASYLVDPLAVSMVEVDFAYNHNFSVLLVAAFD